MKLKFIIILAGVSILLILTVIILANLTVYKTKPFDRTVLGADAKANPAQYPDGCYKTEAVISVTPIHSGDLVVMLSNPVNLAHPAYAGTENIKLTVPVFAYLVCHEKYGCFLIDSGCSSSYAENPYGPMKGPIVSKVTPQTQLDAEDAIERQLSDVPDEIKGVFFTHLHFDHTSGLPALPDNLLFFAGMGEQSVNIKWLLEANHFKKTDTVYMFDFNGGDAQEWSVGKAIDIFGDQSLWAISTPGHSKGHVSYLVNTPEHPILIAGDACTTNDNLKLGVRSGSSSADQTADQNTVEKIKEFAERHTALEVWTGHDYPVGFDETDGKNQK